MNKGKTLLNSDSSRKVFASLLSIVIGLAVGALVAAIVGLSKDNIGPKGIWDGVRLIFLGLLSTGREAGQLTWGFNPSSWGNMLFRATPLIMTGLSVAVAFKTGLFNIGAPGQYLMAHWRPCLLLWRFPLRWLPPGLFGCWPF